MLGFNMLKLKGIFSENASKIISRLTSSKRTLLEHLSEKHKNVYKHLKVQVNFFAGKKTFW